MPTFKPKTPVVTETPLVVVEGLEPGEHTFQLEVEDDAGNRSQPFTASVRVVRAGPSPDTLAAAPTITGLSPAFGDWGDQVVIRGTNFDPEPTKNGVSFNGVNAPVVSAAAQQLVVRVPRP
jgi:hypothetical protein